jgi:peptidyl-prolyl cis-trans isomerase C
MLRRTIVAAALCAIVIACGQGRKGHKSGPAVAKGNGITITADEFKARIDEQSPFIRARYTTLERKKEFLDNLVRFEVLANEAEKQGLANDPDVQLTLKKIMVQKLVQKNFADQTGAKDMPEPELTKYYEEHKGEYNRPKRVRLSAIVLQAPAGTPDRAKKAKVAKEALAKVKAEEAKKNPLAFNQAVAQYSEDPASKNLGGDLQFKSREELEGAFGKEVADAAFALKVGDVSGVIESPKGLYVLKATGMQEEMNRTFDQVKQQIASKLYREKKTKEFDAWLKHLKDQANVQVDDKVLDAVPVSAEMPPGMDGLHGGMGHGGSIPMGAGPGGMGPRVVPTTPPTQAPAKAPAPAPAAK